MLGLLIGAVLAAPAAAQFALEPDWAKQPDQAEMSREYPKLALALAIEGQVVMACDVTVTGSLKSCAIHEETPKGFGFGVAALRMSRSFEMRPGIGGRRTTPYGDVRIPIYFRLPAYPPDPPAPALSPPAKALAARLVANVDPAPGFLAQYQAEAGRLATGGGATPETGAEAAKALLAAAEAQAPVLRQRWGEIVAARLSDTELAAFVAFAESDTGRRWFAVDPVQRDKQKLARAARQSRDLAAARKIFCARHDCVGAPEPPKATRQDAATDPDAPLPFVPWSQRPGYLDSLKAWPVASLFRVPGYARSVCTIGLQGAPEDCEITYESPKALGLGAAAQRLVERYRVAPDFLATGVGKRVVISTIFPPLPLADDAPAKASPPPVSSARLALANQIVALQIGRTDVVGDEAGMKVLRASLTPLPPQLAQDVESALTEAMKAGRDQAGADLAAILAESYDEDALRRAFVFERDVAPAIQRAVRASDDERKAIGLAMTNHIAIAARESVCKTRDCKAPAFKGPPPAMPPEPGLLP